MYIHTWPCTCVYMTDTIHMYIFTELMVYLFTDIMLLQKIIHVHLIEEIVEGV